MGILQFLDVPKDKLEETYFEMISPKDFKELNGKASEVWIITGGITNTFENSGKTPHPAITPPFYLLPPQKEL